MEETKETFVLFYGGVFSQWFPCKFIVDGVEYNRTEQYMMHQKALLFGDKDTAEKIMQETSPKEQKALGRLVKGFDKTKWNAKARDIVYKGNWHKFSQNEALKEVLLMTDGTLVEASPRDRIWGIGLGMSSEKALDRSMWRGTNWLGEVLTKVRDDLSKNVYTTEEFGWSDGKKQA